MNLIILKNKENEMYTKFKQILEKKHLQDSNLFCYHITYSNDEPVINVECITKNGPKMVAEMSPSVARKLFEPYEITKDEELYNILDSIITKNI